jgi:peptidoglycan-associated lipoprotein
MILAQRGRGGWENNSGRLCRAVALLFVTVALAAAGCSSNKSQQPGANGTNGAGGLNSNDLGANGNSSLKQFGNGQLGNGENGPLADIHFGYNDYTISDQDGAVLKSNAKWLQDNPGKRVQIEGHCDDRGSEEYNIALGARRAQAAKDYLETLGIQADRMSTISYGKELPLCHEENDECWAQNRRDHFVIQGS